MNNSDYMTEEECRYYGSDLNKFVHKECSKEMSAINVDLLMYKASKKSIRLIESKHTKEDLTSQQSKILGLFSKFCSFAGFNFEVFVVYGNPPDYDHVTIDDLITKKRHVIKDSEVFKKWLEFEIDL